MEYNLMSLGQYFCIQDCLNIVFLQCTVWAQAEKILSLILSSPNCYTFALASQKSEKLLIMMARQIFTKHYSYSE